MSQTLADVLQAAVAQLQTVSDSARLDAELLLAHSLERPRSWVISHGDDELGAAALSGFRALVARRSAGVPIAYLLGRREFWSLELEVTPAVLIPRPETETLVQAALDRIPAGKACCVADLGTGSGAIALALAHERPQCTVVATDSSADALQVALRNANRLGLTRVELRQGTWFAALGEERYDLLVANPPYVAADDPHLEALLYEPRRALVAADAGLADLRHLIEHAAAHLAAGGWLLLEHGATQDQAVRELLTLANFTRVATLPDLAGLPRVSLGRTT